MQTVRGWGNVVVAIIFAVVVIGTATATYFFEKNGGGSLIPVGAKSSTDTDGDGLSAVEELAWHTDPAKADTDGDGASDGAEVAAHTDPTKAGASVNAYESWSGTSPTNSFAQNAAIARVTLSADAPQSAISAAAKTAAQNVPLPDLNENIPLSAVRIDDSISIELYGEIVRAMLRETANIRQYELDLFNRSISSDNYLGDTQLKAAATIYKDIEAGLLGVATPPSLAFKHLALVNAVGTLGNITLAMGSWGGDSLAGIAYIDAFLKAEDAFGKAIDDVLTQVLAENPTQ